MCESLRAEPAMGLKNKTIHELITGSAWQAKYKPKGKCSETYFTVIDQIILFPLNLKKIF